MATFFVLGAGWVSARTSPNTRYTAPRVRLTSSSPVRQLETEMRRMACPCQVDGVIQAVPSASSRRATSRVTSSDQQVADLSEDDVVDHPYAIHLVKATGELLGPGAEPLDHLGHAGPAERPERRPDGEARARRENSGTAAKGSGRSSSIRYAACRPIAAYNASGSATMASPLSYGTLSVLCASVAQESASSTPATSDRSCDEAAAHKPKAPSTCTQAPCWWANSMPRASGSKEPLCTLPACRQTINGPGARSASVLASASSACIRPWTSAGTTTLRAGPNPR